jgi:hypothetical protein
MLPLSTQSPLLAVPLDTPERVTVELAERVVNAPEPGVTSPIEAKFAAPAPVMFQLASFNAKSVPVFRPMVMVPVEVPVPMFVAAEPEPFTVVAPVIPVVPAIVSVSSAEPIVIVSAVVLSLAILIAFPAVPVAMLTVFALLLVPRLTVPVDPESSVNALAPAADLMVKAPESAILFVVKVCEPMVVPDTNEATPAPVTLH